MFCPNCGYKNLLKDESSYKSKKEKDEISLYVECQKMQKIIFSNKNV